MIPIKYPAIGIAPWKNPKTAAVKIAFETKRSLYFEPMAIETATESIAKATARIRRVSFTRSPKQKVRNYNSL